MSDTKNASHLEPNLPHVPSYLRAMGAVNELLKVSPDVARAIRAEHPDLRQVTETELMRFVPRVPPELATALCAPFSR
ncbi:hypothetical protein [Methylobacterium sp. P1-11]|uniref:hypothetical protein n=1 Tax=Methylobacterium sp. P1-11 TaxID=2024616 RepID=UPI0011ED39C9|nr:hypothetical protein [Methylobacterium sp. P1-11]